MKTLETKIPPPVLLAIVAALMWLLARYTYVFSPPPQLRMGFVLFFVAVALLYGVPAVLAFRQHKTTVDPVHVEKASKLVTSSSFSFSRNPMYTAMLMLLFAWVFYLGSPWALLLAILFELYLLFFQIWPEERAMLAKFGADYLDYAKKVRRWI